MQVSLTGTGALAGDTVQLYNGSTTASQLGTSYTLTATDITNGFANVQTGTLTDGTTYAITARVTDSAGNQSGASGSFTVTEDTTAPAAPTSLTLDPTTDSGTVGDNKTNVQAVKIDGTAEPGSTVTLYDGATPIGTGTANVTGAFSSPW